VASFQTGNPLPLERIFHGLNALLPFDVAAVRWAEAEDGFHARHSATSREYCYQVWRGRVCSPFLFPFVHHLYREPVDLDAMNQAAALVVGAHDFTSFCATESLEENMIRDVHLSRWDADGEIWRYRVRARSFVHHMVRNLVGTFVEVGLGRRRPRDLETILAARDRRAAGPTAPAQGLFLERVGYGDVQNGEGEAR
jgi:tRNA pseudouridine38-40 synthase